MSGAGRGTPRISPMNLGTPQIFGNEVEPLEYPPNLPFSAPYLLNDVLALTAGFQPAGSVQIPVGVTRVALSFKYTQGGLGGLLHIRPFWNAARLTSPFSKSFATNNNVYLMRADEYSFEDTATETLVLALSLPGHIGIPVFSLEVRDSGATPGTLILVRYAFDNLSSIGMTPNLVP